MTDPSAQDDAESDTPEKLSPEPEETPLPFVLQQSVCSRCDHRKIIRSGKGSVFLLCQVGLTNQHWPKYPPQPVQRCPKFTTEN